MPRLARSSLGGICYHVVDRGNARATVYHDEQDYASFLRLIRRACEEVPMRVLAFCLMPNHLHFVVWPSADGDLGRWMHWLLTTHVHGHHKRYRTSGRIWQGRYKAFPIQQDHHLLAVLRYVERNALRAQLVERAEHWPWSSVRWWGRRSQPEFLVSGPVAHPSDWILRVNEPVTDAELEAVRLSVRRSRPFGAEKWVKETAKSLGMESTLRDPGRPRGVQRDSGE
jgi:REP-associated tyrosine transposase